VEQHVLPELEGVEQAIRRHLPGLGRIADELAVGRDVDQPAADVHGDPHHFVAGRGVEIEVRNLVAIRHAERAAALGRLRIGGQGGGGEGEQREEAGDEAAS
jgi:hypothetical protein